MEARGNRDSRKPRGSLGAAVVVDAAPYVSLKVDEGSVADTGFTHLRDRLEGVGQGFAVGVVGGPILAEALCDAACAYNREGEGKTTLEGSDAAPYLSEGH